GFDLRDVDRLLLLVDARLHAIVADAVTGAREHRVVEADERERSDRVALTLERVHLRDFFVERTAGERHPKAVRLDRTALVLEALRARILIAVVAVNAVIDLCKHLSRVHPPIGEREAITH